MAEILKTNVCCLDLGQDCIDYLRSLELAVFEGSLGSVLSFDWRKMGSPAYLRGINYTKIMIFPF